MLVLFLISEDNTETSRQLPSQRCQLGSMYSQTGPSMLKKIGSSITFSGSRSDSGDFLKTFIGIFESLHWKCINCLACQTLRKILPSSASINFSMRFLQLQRISKFFQAYHDSLQWEQFCACV